tara:strand:- start:101 stop:436 length:336 start_codon:yes stop_codon:yes gene_type:complete
MSSSFSERVILLALNIPTGKVTTYGDLARAAGGSPLTARSITTILSKYPKHELIPWHRIVYAGGKVWLGDDASRKRRVALYKKEKIRICKQDKICNFEDCHLDWMELRELL